MKPDEIESLFCKLFLLTDLRPEALMELMISHCGLLKEGIFSLTSGIAEVHVARNQNAISEYFMDWPIIMEVWPKFSTSREDFVWYVHSLILSLEAKVGRVVVACHFEDELQLLRQNNHCQ